LLLLLIEFHWHASQSEQVEIAEDCPPADAAFDRQRMRIVASTRLPDMQDSQGNNAISQQADADSDALSTDPRLAEIIERWPALSESTKARITALAKPKPR
jgi:hypothetical protein